MQCLTQNDQQAFAITIVHHDGLTPVTLRGHVIVGTWKLDSQWSCHFMITANRRLSLVMDGGHFCGLGQEARPAINIIGGSTAAAHEVTGGVLHCF